MPAPAWRRRLMADRLTLVAGGLALLLFAVAARPAPAAPATGDVLVVADLRGHALLLIDVARPAAARRILLPGGPHELLRLPDGRIAVSLEQSGAVALVDLATGEVEHHAVGGRPHGLAYEPDGALLLVTDRDAEAVRRFTVAEWEERAPLPAAGWPHAVVRSAHGEVVVALAAADALTVAGRRIDAPCLPETVALSAGGRIATAGALDGVVAIYDADGRRIETHAVGGRPVRVRFDDAGGRLAVALSSAGAVALVQDGRVEHVAVAGVPDGLAFSVDGRRLYVSDLFGGTLTIVDLERREVIGAWRAGTSTGAIMVLPRG